MKKIFGMIGLVVMLCASGCGYTTGSLLPSHYNLVFVTPVENGIDYLNQEERKLYIPGMETRVRTALIDRFMLDGKLRVGEQDNADLVLEIKLLSFEREDIRLTETEDVKEYRLRITVAMKMIDKTDHDTVIWEESSFAGESTYFTTGARVKSESAAIEEALKDLAQRVVARTIENW